MRIFDFEAGPILTKCYLVYDENTGIAVAIDSAPESANVYLDECSKKNLKLEKILLTHSHWDHFSDAKKIIDNSKASLLVHKKDEFRLLNPMKHTIFPLPFEIEPIKPDLFINENDVIEFGNLKLEVLHTPGHTEGGVCFVEHSQKVIFSGDTIFNQSIGRTDLPGGSLNVLLKSIKEKIFTLPDDYAIYPGHGDSTTVGEEKEFNPFFY